MSTSPTGKTKQSSSSVDSHVPTSPTPESERAWMAMDPAYGSRWPAAFGFYNPDWSSSKTSQESCEPWLAARGSLLSESSSLTWPKSGMTLDGVAYELPTWELLISAPEYSSSLGEEDLLPTPKSRDYHGTGQYGREGGSDLKTAVTLLPTPVAEEPRGTAEQHLARKMKADGYERTAVTSLGVLVKTLPTPTAGDAKSSGSRNLEGSKAKDGVSLTDAVRFGDSKTPRMLPTPMANEKNPGSGGELRAAIVHGEGRRNETGTDTWGRPNMGRPKMLPTPTTQDANNNAGPSQQQRNSDPLNVVAAKLLPSPTTHASERGKGDAERYRGPKSQGSRRSNIEDAIEAVMKASPWIGESSLQPSSDGNSSPDVHPDQLTIGED